MARQVMMPQKKNDMSQLLQMGGTVAGGILGGLAGGPAGAIGGASGGGALAGSVGNMVGIDGGGSAMERRLQAQASPTQTPQVEDPMTALQNARVALAQQPKEIQQEYTPILQAAMLKAKRGNGGIA